MIVMRWGRFDVPGVRGGGWVTCRAVDPGLRNATGASIGAGRTRPRPEMRPEPENAKSPECFERDMSTSRHAGLSLISCANSKLSVDYYYNTTSHSSSSEESGSSRSDKNDTSCDGTTPGSSSCTAAATAFL